MTLNNFALDNSTVMSPVLTYPDYSKLDLDKYFSDLATKAGFQRLANLRGVWRLSVSSNGKAITILAGIHGNEPSGIYAFEKLLRKIASKELILACGTITLVLGNELAIKANKRFIYENLNRVFDNKENSKTNYERNRALELTPVILNSDLVLDLHSTSQPTYPFGICNESNISLGLDITLPHLVYSYDTEFDSFTPSTALGVAFKNKINGCIIESGQHVEPSTYESAYKYLVKFLQLNNFIEDDFTTSQELINQVIYRLFGVERLLNDTFKYTQSLVNFSWIKQGECIGSYYDRVITVDRSFVVFMPTLVENLVIGEEMFYLLEPELF
jgi:succinylglutamate desuccinylase